MCACGEEYWIHYHGTQVSYVTEISSSYVCVWLCSMSCFFPPFPFSHDLSFFVCHSLFFALWNVHFCVLGVGLSAPSRWEANGFVVKLQRDGFLQQAGVWADWTTCITYCGNPNFIFSNQPLRGWMLMLPLPLETDKWELIHINLLNLSNTCPGQQMAHQRYWVGGSWDAWAALWYLSLFACG